MCFIEWHQYRWPWVTLNVTVAVSKLLSLLFINEYHTYYLRCVYTCVGIWVEGVSGWTVGSCVVGGVWDWTVISGWTTVELVSKTGCEYICPTSIWVLDGSARPLKYPRVETSIKGGPADPSAPGLPPEVDFPSGAEGASAAQLAPPTPTPALPRPQRRFLQYGK